MDDQQLVDSQYNAIRAMIALKIQEIDDVFTKSGLKPPEEHITLMKKLKEFMKEST
jgi:hypothetical protein